MPTPTSQSKSRRRVNCDGLDFVSTTPRPRRKDTANAYYHFPHSHRKQR